MLRRSSPALALILVFVLLLSACGSSGSPTQGSSTEADVSASAAVVAGGVTATAAATTGEAPAATSDAAAAATTAEAPAATSDAAAASGDQVTIKVVSWVPDNIDSWANRTFKPFMDEHPNIRIVHEHIGANYIETVLTRLSGSNDIDIVTVAPDNTGIFLRAGAALNLDQYIEQNREALELDTFPAWTLEDFSTVRYPDVKTGSGQYGIPLVMFVWEMWHNADMFEQAGLSIPERGWTWDNFVEIATKLTNQGERKFGYENQNWMLPLFTWIWQGGGEMLSEDNTKLAIGSPENIKTFSFLQKLQLEDKVFPAPETVATEGGGINFNGGNVGMITRGNWNVDLTRDFNFKWDVSYPPKGEEEATVGEAVGYIINANSAKKEAAWTFLQWVLSPEGQRTLAPRDIVPNSEVMREVGLQLQPENVRNIVVPLSGDPMVRGFPQWFRPKYGVNDLQERLSVLWTGERKAEELLPELEKEFNDALSQPLP